MFLLKFVGSCLALVLAFPLLVALSMLLWVFLT